MKGNLTTVALMLSSCLIAGQAIAADGIIHFRGEVTDSTCEINSDDTDQYVDLHKVGASSLSGQVGTTTTPTAFDIRLDKCPATFTKASAMFDGQEDPNSTGDLAIGSGNAPVDDKANASGDYTGDTLPAVSATGVAIRITNRADKSVVKIYDASAPADISSGSTTLQFLAQYISTNNTVTPGTGNADAQFTISYLK
jgi:major type 1 subunit fimbrin (pilin)